MRSAWGCWRAWLRRKEVESAAAVGLCCMCAQCTNALSSVFRLSQSDAEVPDSWGGKTKHYVILTFSVTLLPKIIVIGSQVKCGTFWDIAYVQFCSAIRLRNKWPNNLTIGLDLKSTGSVWTRMPRPDHVVQWSNYLASCVVERDVRGCQGSRFGAQSETRSGKARPPIVKNYFITMWANAQRDGRPAEYRWRPLFNAAVWLTPTTRCRAVTLPRRETCWNYLGCPKLTKRSQPLVGRSSPYCGGI